MQTHKIRGRSSAFNPQNRFEPYHIEPLTDDNSEDAPSIATQFFEDTSKSILAKNDSYDISFNYSINPYRGCEHGCIYCYARQTHEYLGFSSGLDFETKIMIKKDAHKLLEAAFKSKNWKPELIVFSGNTDCYQPVERKLQITRRCLEVFLKYKNPVAIITKNSLIERDIDIISELAKMNLVHTTISITTLDPLLARKMEPRTSAPLKRINTIKMLADNKIPVGVNIAPLIPGLNDEEIPSILKEASEHGASYAAYILLRLPFSVKDLFVDWMRREYPERAHKVVNKIKEIRGGKLNESALGKRFDGIGKTAEIIKHLFKVSCRKYHLNEQENELQHELFNSDINSQFKLF